ncbi:unnamed protein product, partial [Discosporangium mesarthrocarpum]
MASEADVGSALSRGEGGVEREWGAMDSSLAAGMRQIMDMIASLGDMMDRRARETGERFDKLEAASAREIESRELDHAMHGKDDLNRPPRTHGAPIASRESAP